MKQTIRGIPLGLAAVVLLSAVMPATAAEWIGDSVTPTYDEAYYATLDYYGNLTDGSVVKSYMLNGAASLTDYGVYDEVINLTDGTTPLTQDGMTKFQFSADSAPEHFYFEGKTSAPFQNLPWTISMSYFLNGVPSKAEDLAGKTGVIEIHIDAIPNANASTYAQNNYTLEAMAIFNQDDILSLEAPGAQIQLVGNLRAVLFLAMPGEEGHFVIRVGTNEFSFEGMTYLMVPATLSQLEEIAKLSERKDDLEEDYDKLSGSMDTLLDSLANLSGSLRDTANGLDQLDRARQSVSDGKDQIKEQGDRALDDLEGLRDTLNLFPKHVDGADDSVIDVTDALTALTDTAVAIRGNLDDISACLEDLEDDLDDFIHENGDVQDALDRVHDDLDRLRAKTNELKEYLNTLDVEINGGIIGTMNPEVRKNIKIKGQSLEYIWTSYETLDSLWTIAAQGNVDTIAFQQFEMAVIASAVKTQSPSLQGDALTTAITSQTQNMNTAVTSVNAAVAQVMQNNPGLTEEQALQTVLASMKASDDTAKAAAAAYEQHMVIQQVYATACGDPGTASMTKEQFFTAMQMMQAISAVNSDDTIQDKQAAISKILSDKNTYAANSKLLLELEGDHAADTARIRGMLGNLADLLGNTGDLTGDLSNLLGELDTMMGDLGDTSSVARETLDKIDDILVSIRNLDDTVNDQVPGIRETLQDTKALIQDLIETTGDTHSLLTSARDLLRSAEDDLDEGTKESLQGLAETLRRTAVSMDATGDVKTAKDAIDGIITDTWEEYTGKVNNMLLMDATAEAQSLTSEQNPAPISVQVLIRSQEIKTEDIGEAGIDAEVVTTTTFWQRVAQMFRDLWNALTGWAR